MNEIVCIDTQILVWGVLKKPPLGEEHLVQLSSDFLRWIEEQKCRVILPTVIVAELLVTVPPEDQTEAMKRFRSDWRVVEFDLPAAQQFAVMRQSQLIKNRLTHLLDPNNPGATREALKADVMIIATAIAQRAQIIYSNDRHLRSLAEGYILAKNFVDETFQRSLNLPDGDEYG